ncbi:MAG: carboxypeptidase-like regulatory domain-containing protein [Bryobacteraceae bacterium]
MRSFLLLALCASALWAQDTALLSGAIVDSGGAPVAVARLRLAARSSDLTVEKTANQGGEFAFDLLPPGEYELTVSKESFETLRVARIVLRARERRGITLTLSPGDTAKVVTLEEPREGLETDIHSAVSANLSELNHLPLNGRNALSLAAAAPSVIVGSAPEAQPNAHALPHHLNYLALDGLNLYEPLRRLGTAADARREPLSWQSLTLSEPAPSLLISLDSLMEARVQTQNFVPQLGRTPGAQVALISRRGQRGFHGSLYNYFRSERFAANDWFANSLGMSRGRLRQNQFGASLGGPVVSGATYFFASYEGLRLDAPQTVYSVVPSPAFRASVPASLRPYVSAYPLPNRPGVSANAAPFTQVFSHPYDRDAVSFRLDQKIGASHALFARVNFSRTDAFSRGSIFLTPNVLRGYEDEYRAATLGVASSLNPHTTNDFRVNFTSVSMDQENRFSDLMHETLPDFNRIFPSGVNPARAEYGFHVLGLSGYSFGPQLSNKQWQINATDTVTMVAGAHSYVAGFDYRYIAPTFQRPDYSSVSWFRALSELQPDGTEVQGSFLSSRSVSSVVAASAGPVYPAFQNLSFFLQDTARIGSRVTLAFGIRWDINSPPGVRRGPRPAALSSAFANRVVQNESLFDTVFSDVAPRFSYTQVISAKPGRELIARIGAGGFHSFGASIVPDFFLGVPYSNVRSMSLPPFPLVGTDLAAPVLPPAKRYGLVIASDRSTLQSPIVRHLNVSLEKHLGNHQVATVSYLSVTGRRLLRTSAERSATADYIDLRKVISVADSSWHALQAQFRRRLSRSFQMQATYTWSHAIDDDAAYGGIGFATIFGNERGNADHDVRHLLNVSGSWLLPAPPTPGLSAALRDWHLEWIATARAGLPFDIFLLNSTPSADAGAVQTPIIRGLYAFVRPNYNGADVWLQDANVAGGRRLNPAAFTAPASNRTGDLGRNILYGRPMAQIDLALRREIPIGESLRVNFAVQAFNLTNSPAFANPDRNEGAFLSSPVFGFPLRSLNASFSPNPTSYFAPGGPRSVQFAIRVQF